MKKFIFTFLTSAQFAGSNSLATLKANNYADLVEEAYKRNLCVYGIEKVEKNQEDKKMLNVVLKNEKKKFLIARVEEHNVYEYVVCSNYNHEIDEWDHGHYHKDLNDALEDFREVTSHD